MSFYLPTHNRHRRDKPNYFTMNKSPKENKFTMQGRDTPVSVGEEVQAQATPDRQPTTAAKSATDIKKTLENDIFVIEDQESPDQFLRRLACSNKRKRLSSPGNEDVGAKQNCQAISKARSILDGFVVISKLCEKLADNIDRNTKKEIKDISIRLTRKIAKLNQIEMWDWLEKIVDDSIESWKNPGPATEQAKPATVEQSTQTDPLELYNKRSGINEDDEMDDTDDNHYTVGLVQPNTGEELKVVLKENWTEKSFTRTTLAVGNPLTQRDKPDIAILVTDSEIALDTGIYKIIADHIPELREDENEDTSPRCIRLSTRYKKDGTWLEKHRNIYKMLIKSREHMEILTALKTLTETATGDGCTALSVPLITEADPETVRRLAEIATSGKNLKIKIHGPKSIMDKILTGQTLTSEPKKSRAIAAKQETGHRRITNANGRGAPKEKSDPKKQKSAIIIRTQGREYSQVLKDIKDTFTAQKDKPTVSGITETKKGDVLITTDNETNATLLQKTLVEKFASENVVLKTGKKRILHVKNIDALSSQAEIEQALKSDTSDIQGNLDITNIRPSFGNCQNATVRTDDKIADRLLQNGYVVIGFTRCKISERIEVFRCNRCWAYDHSKKDCNGPDRARLCLKCGQPGHKSTDCKGPNYCPLCDSQTHSAASLRCPQHSRAIQEIRWSKHEYHNHAF